MEVEVRAEGCVAVITVNRPEKLNALNSRVLALLGEALASVTSDDGIRVTVVTGFGEKAFVAGADVSEMLDMTPSQAVAFSELGHRVFGEIERCPKPVIAAVNGYAFGGGFELALACDMRIASEKAVFGFPEVGLGIIPGFGGTQRLSRLIGKGLAKEMILTGRHLDAGRAFALGLVTAVVPTSHLLQETMRLASEISKMSPHALALAKRAIDGGHELDMEGALHLERDMFSKAFQHPDRKEGMAAFLEKRRPCFSNIAVNG